MAITYKILGQSNPTDTNNADVYTVPASTSAVISTISITNTETYAASARIFIRKFSGTLAAASKSNALVYDVNIDPNSVTAITIGPTLAASDTITVRSSVSSTLTFQVFGSEITP